MYPRKEYLRHWQYTRIVWNTAIWSEILSYLQGKCFTVYKGIAYNKKTL